ncbi:hypothetical protein DYL61_25045 [Pseudomonas nabeulensis]|uniref:Uncharacterized protein n=1 Tax=Pseudomonas nabeulensis TaxID=2293833 RepID=A0A4Z0AML9_9PSED|nr:DUF6543 domain-containing protein [Pseudomonas nabeulensis]TFY88036.1 hypothetical protein DYL61_25045 [Pseudomonas nabeulensis]
MQMPLQPPHNDDPKPLQAGNATHDLSLPVTLPIVPPASLSADEQQAHFIHALSRLNTQTDELLQQQPSMETVYQLQLAAMFPELVRPINPNRIFYTRYREAAQSQTQLLSSEPFGSLLNRLRTPDANAYLTEETGAFYREAQTLDADKRLSVAAPIESLASAMEVALTVKLNAFWRDRKNAQPNVEDRLIALRRQVLAHQLALHTVDGTLSAAGRTLADNVLKYPTAAAREKVFLPLQRPSVCRLALADGSQFAAAFIISNTADPVLLYTPGEGFEEYDNLTQLNQRVAARLRENASAGKLLAAALPATARQTANDAPVLAADPPVIEADVIADSVRSLRVRQYFNTRALLRKSILPVSGELEQAAHLAPQLDTATALAARNLQLVRPHEPGWLKAANPQDQEQYRRYEAAMIESNDTLVPLLEKILSLVTFSEDEVSRVLKRQKPEYAHADLAPYLSLVRLRVTSSADVEVTGYRDESAETVYISEDPNIDVPLFLHEQVLTKGRWRTKRVVDLRTLASYARRNVDPWSLHEVHRTITATAELFDRTGARVGRLNDADLRTLAHEADIGKTYDEYLRSAFSPRGDGRVFATAWQRANAARMRKEALESRLNPAISDLFTFKTPGSGLDWIHAITHYPDPSTRPQVSTLDIEAHLLVMGSGLEGGRGGQVINGVLVIQRKGTKAGGVCVLYTPDAPDNAPFRELVTGLGELDTLKAKPQWRAYFTRRMATRDAQELARIFNDTRSANRYTLSLIASDLQAFLYSAQLGFQLAHADHRSRSNAQIAWESAVNAFVYGFEIADVLTELLMVKTVHALLHRAVIGGLRRAQKLGRSIPGLLGKSAGARATSIKVAKTSIRPLDPAWVNVAEYRLPDHVDALFDVEAFAQTHHYRLSRSLGAPSFIDSRNNQFIAMRADDGRYYLYPSYVEDGARYVKDPLGLKPDFMVVPGDAKSWKPRFERTTRGGGPVLSALRPFTAEQQLDDDLIRALGVYSSSTENQHYAEVIQALSGSQKQKLRDQAIERLGIDEVTFRRIVSGDYDVPHTPALRNTLLEFRFDTNIYLHLNKTTELLSNYLTLSPAEMEKLFIKIKRLIGKNDDFSKHIRASLSVIDHDTGAQFVGYAFTQKQMNNLKKFDQKFKLSTWRSETLNAFLDEKGRRVVLAKIASEKRITPEDALQRLLTAPQIQEALKQFRIDKQEELLKRLGVVSFSDEFKKAGIPYIAVSYGDATAADTGLKVVDSISVVAFEKNIPQFSTPLEFLPSRVPTHKVEKPLRKPGTPSVPEPSAPSDAVINIVKLDELADAQLALLPANAKTKVEEIIQDIQAGRVSRKKIGNYTYVDLPQLDTGTGRGRWRVAVEKTGKEDAKDLYVVRGIIDYHGSKPKVWGM